MSAASKVAQGASGSPTAGGGFDLIRLLLEGRAFFALIVIVVVFSTLSPVYFSTANFLVMASHVAIYGLLAIGMLLVILTGGIDLSVGAVVAFMALQFRPRWCQTTWQIRGDGQGGWCGENQR